MGHISILGYEPPHLSYSTVSGYRMCGRQFYFSKVALLEERPGLAATAGNAVHSATEWIDLAEYAGVPVEEVMRAALDNAGTRANADNDEGEL